MALRGKYSRWVYTKFTVSVMTLWVVSNEVMSSHVFLWGYMVKVTPIFHDGQALNQATDHMRFLLSPTCPSSPTSG